MTPPPNGEASFSLEAGSGSGAKNIPPAGSEVRVQASIRVRDIFTGSRRLETGRATNCSLKMFLDGTNIYDRGLAITGDNFEDITSNSLMSSENPKIDMTQECGESPVELTVNGAALTGPDSGGSDGGSDGSDSDSDTGPETGTAVAKPTSTGSASDDSGDGSSDAGVSVVNMVAVYALSFVAALIFL